MMFNVVESGKAQNVLPILNFFDIRLEFSHEIDY